MTASTWGFDWSDAAFPKFPPFEERKPQTKAFYAVKLSANNLAALASFYITHGGLEMVIPASRDHLSTFHPAGGFMRFEFGEWIVLDWEETDDGNKAAYRRPTRQEVETYGLNV